MKKELVLDDLGITVLGVALTLYLYADFEEGGVLKLNDKIMTKYQIDDLLKMDGDTSKRYLDELKAAGFIDYKRKYDQKRKLTVNIYELKVDSIEIKFVKDVAIELVSKISMEARGLIFKMLPYVEAEKCKVKIFQEQGSTFNFLKKIATKSQRSIERYIAEYQYAELMAKDFRKTNFNFIINPEIFKAKGDFTEVEREALECIKSSKKATWEFIEKKKERMNKKTDVIKPHKIILNKRNSNEYYDRKKIEKLLPFFNGTVIDEWKNILYQFDDSCALTGKIIKVNRITKGMEHFIPLSIGHGGTNEQNVYPMDSFLNYSKNNKNPFIWIRELEFSTLIEHDDYPKIYENFQMLIEYLAIKNKLNILEYEEYVNWCFDNSRTIDEIKKDLSVSSLELWKLYKNKNSQK